MLTWRRSCALLLCLIASAAEARVPVNGDWYSDVAISPDGAMVLFSYKGDIYQAAASGGPAIPLTLNSAWDGRPVWSHDGKWIAFASDRYGNLDIFLMPAGGGTAQRLTHHSADDVPSDFTADNKAVLFSSTRIDDVRSAKFPISKALGQLYAVSLTGGAPRMVLTTPALDARTDSSGRWLLYHDVKGDENPWRKHQISAATRDIWLYDTSSHHHRKLTDFGGEDVTPVWSVDGKSSYYLSEQSGSFNVWKLDVETGVKAQVTHHEIHPVRSLSLAQDGTLAYTYDGSMYRLQPGGKSEKIAVTVSTDRQELPVSTISVAKDISEFSVSPSGKEIAFIARGEVFVSSVEFGTTKRMTNTPGLERSVSFSPDGRTLLYAGERNGGWKLYEAHLADPGEPAFFAATKITERLLLADSQENFQPVYSPDGKSVAYLADHYFLKVLDLKSGKHWTVLSDADNYSDKDGDRYFSWSPDSRWLVTSFHARGRYGSDNIGIVPADGSAPVRDVSLSGYSSTEPQWSAVGAVLWRSNRYGARPHAGWGGFGGETDIVALFLTPQAFDAFRLSAEDVALRGDKKFTPSHDIDWTDPGKRTMRLTPRSSDIAEAGFATSPDGQRLYYLSRYEKAYDLWVQELRGVQELPDGAPRRLARLDAEKAGLRLAQDGKTAFVLADGRLMSVSLDDANTPVAPKLITPDAIMALDADAERAAMFEHVWRLVRQKFYVPDLHGADWNGLRQAYAAKLPAISNNRDMAVLLSEMLGELNASHTGASYLPAASPAADDTAALGLFHDSSYAGPGLKIAEVISGGPLDRADLGVTPGMVISHIDGVPLTGAADFDALLNHKAGKRVRLTLVIDSRKGSIDRVLRPITLVEQSELLYRRWVEKRRALVDKLSGGRLGYVHIRRMKDEYFRNTYADVFGRDFDKEGLVVDTRYNGGGAITDDLVSLFTGKPYFWNTPRGRRAIDSPFGRWSKPIITVISEGNYSDAYLTPYAFKELGVSKLVGMPVASSGVAVMKEDLQSGDLNFIIAATGVQNSKGQFLERVPVEPDFEVNNDPESLAAGRDLQLEKAVQLLLDGLTPAIGKASGN